MPPKKRKSEKDLDVSSDEEKETKRATSSKRGRQTQPKEEAKIKFELEWCEHGEPGQKNIRPLYYLWSKTQPGCAKIAAFDIDFTVIVTKSGKKFATGADDWKWFDKTVPEKLKELHEQGYRVVFITNQGGIEKQKTSFAELKTKFRTMLNELDIPVFILVSTSESHFRKPSTEMWNYLMQNLNNSTEVNISECFYVGDAAGRAKNWAPGKSKDFSCSDRMFAHNLNIKFYTPEEFFLKHKPVKFEWGSIDPNEILKKNPSKNADIKEYHSIEKELVLLLGPPASGKSTFVKKYLLPFNYVHVNRDTLQTQEKCLKAAESALKEGKSVVVDNTNPSKRTRADYVNLAKKLGLGRIRCFKMQTDIELCHHLNYVRQNQTQGKVRRIPDVGYNMYKSQFEEAELSEGFSEIVKVNFVPEFNNDNEEKIFKQWTC